MYLPLFCTIFISLTATCLLSTANPVGHGHATHHMHPRLPRHAPAKYAMEMNPDFWLDKGQDIVRQNVNKRVNTNRAKNVILFLGDGMSIPTLAASRVYKGGEEAELSFEKFPHTGLAKTYCLNNQVADSACSGTAYLSGVKANFGTIGLNGRASRMSCDEGLNPLAHTSSIAKWAQDAGKVTGIVTTTRITHASPASVYAHIADRDWENNAAIKEDNCDDEKIDDIAEQMIHGDVGKNLKVILGGGRQEFLDARMMDEEGKPGLRDDGKNLIKEWEAMGGKRSYVWNREDLMNVNASSTDHLLGLFESGHNLFYLEALEKDVLHVEPTLKDMVQKAIDILSVHDEGFFLFVEGGLIDTAHHDLQARRALAETVQFAEAVEYARDRMSEEDTLVVVTADHAHTMTYAGYAERGHDVLDFGGYSHMDNMPYFTLSYANGHAYVNHTQPTGGRADPRNMERTAQDFAYPVTVPRYQETHGGDDVSVYASGPWSHIFTGNYEQNAIPHLMAYASCLGNGLKSCS